VLNITSAGWQVILCDPIWHMSSHSGEASCELLYSVHLYLTLNVSALWVSQNLCAHDQCQWVASSQELLISYTSDEELFCRRLVTGDKLWIYHWDPLSKLKFMQWKDVYCPTFTSMCNSAINWLDYGNSFSGIQTDCLWQTICILEAGKTAAGQYYTEPTCKLLDVMKQKQ